MRIQGRPAELACFIRILNDEPECEQAAPMPLVRKKQMPAPSCQPSSIEWRAFLVWLLLVGLCVGILTGRILLG
jgi:hypothetical protein